MSPKVVRVAASLNSIQVTLNKESEKIAFIEASGASLFCNFFPDTMDVSGILTKLFVSDLQTASDIVYIHGGEDLIQFNYKTFSTSQASNYPGYPSSLSVNTNSVRFVYRESFVKTLQVYFNEISEMQQLVQSTATLASGMVSNLYSPSNLAQYQPTLKYQFLIKNPQGMYSSSPLSKL